MDEDDIPLARLKEIWHDETEKSLINDTINLLQTIEQVEYSYKDVDEWNKDVIIQNNTDSTDDELHDNSDDSDNEVLGTEDKKISHSEVLEALKIVTQWTHQNPIDITDITALKRIEEKAVVLNLSQKKVQTKITSYFK